MHPLARVLAVAYLVLAAVAGVVYVQTTLNFVNVTEINVNIYGHVAVAGVEILWNRSSGTDPVVKVSVNVTNPGRIAIEVTDVSFELHMDDPNDAYPWFSDAGLALTTIRSGGFTISQGNGIVIPPGETRTVTSVVPVQGPTQLSRFDTPDANGLYYPVVWSPRLVYFFVGFDLYNIVFFAPYRAAGVLPLG